MDHPHPEVAALLAKLYCGNCHTRRGQGLVVSVEKREPKVYQIACRCLRCGMYYSGPFNTDEAEPGDSLPTLGRTADPISRDELLDLKSMPEPTFANEWAKLTKASS